MESNRVFQKIETFNPSEVEGLAEAKKEIFTDFDGSTVTFSEIEGKIYIMEMNTKISK